MTELLDTRLDRLVGARTAKALDSARDLVRRRYGDGTPDDLALRRKAADLLMRRGFPGDIVRSATRFDPDD